MKKIVSVFLVMLFILVLISVPVSAEEKKEEYYILSDSERIPMPVSYTCEKVMNYFNGNLNKATDLYIDDDRMYIADSGNNRVIVSKLDGNVIMTITEADGVKLDNPSGVTTDSFGGIYVSDTGNARILHYSSKGKLVEVFTAPQSTLLGKIFDFNPTKIAVTNNGYIYAIKSQTIMTIDSHNEFRGYLGQPEVGFDLVEALVRIFASEEQKATLEKRVAEPYINMTIGSDGLIYAVSRDTKSGEIKVLNTVGENIYPQYGSAENTIFTHIRNVFFSVFNIGTYTAKDFYYGERIDDEGAEITPVFSDIAVDDKGIITVVDENTAKCYQYDNQGNLLTAFGGKGNVKGKFQNPTAIACGKNGEIYILDSTLNSIQVFYPTEFIKTVHTACDYYSKGEYDEAYEYWKKIAHEDANYELAGIGMGKALYKQKDYKGAMKQFKAANDPSKYSEAYAKYRHQLFREHFFVAVIIIIALIVVLVLIITAIKRLALVGYKTYKQNTGQKRIGNSVATAFNTLFHPFDTFDVIKMGRSNLSVIAPVIVILLAVGVRILSLFGTSYCMRAVELRNANIWLELAKILLPIISWSVSSFMVSAISDGESKFLENFTATSFCMMPLIVITPILTACSHILSRNEAVFFNAIQVIMWCWILLLLMLCMKTLNGYTLKKTIGVCILSLLAMALIWAVCFLFIAIMGEVGGFLADLFKEYKLRLS